MKTQEYTQLSIMVLMAAWHGGEDAYVGTIRQILHDRTGQLYSADGISQELRRMVDRGMLASRAQSKAKAKAERHCGSPKTIYRLTAAGRRAMQDHMQTWARLQRGLSLNA